MLEYTAVLNEKGELTERVVSIEEAHKKGIWHQTVHVWLFTRQGEVLLQQRSRKKTIRPLLWDVSAAGHIHAGEEVVQAAVREVEEELGLTLKETELLKIATTKHKTTYLNSNITDCEFHQVFIAQCPKNSKFILDKKEVEALKWVNFSTFKTLLNRANNRFFIKTNAKYYLFVLDEIRKQLC